MNDSDTDANSKAIDCLLNFETVKYFANEAMEAERFDRSMARYESAAISIWTSLGWLNFGQAFIFCAGTVVVMCMSALEVQAGTLTVGDFVFINAFLMQISVPLNFIGFVYREIRQGLTDIEEMFKLLDRQAGDRRQARRQAARRHRPVIQFDDVHFPTTPTARSSRASASRCRPARRSPSSGPSGAGKSTISRLLYPLLRRPEGQITIDGQDVRDVTQESLRAAIGMVPQDTVLFNDTIAYNIRYGRLDASEEDVRKAAELAQIGAFHREAAQGLPTRGRRARPETLRRRKAARRHRPHHPQGAADPDPRRGDLGARQPDRAGHPVRARPRLPRTARPSSSPTGCRR